MPGLVSTDSKGKGKRTDTILAVFARNTRCVRIGKLEASQELSNFTNPYKGTITTMSNERTKSIALTALLTASGLIALWMGCIALFGFDGGPMVAFCSILVLIGLTGVWLGNGYFPMAAGNLLTLLCLASGERFDLMHISGLSLFLLGLLTHGFGHRWTGSKEPAAATPVSATTDSSDPSSAGGGEEYDQQRA